MWANEGLLSESVQLSQVSWVYHCLFSCDVHSRLGVWLPILSSCSQECSRLLVVLYSEQRSDLLHSVVSGLHWALSQLYQPGDYHCGYVLLPFHCTCIFPAQCLVVGGRVVAVWEASPSFLFLTRSRTALAFYSD